MIDAFMQEDFCGAGVADEGERSGGGGDEAYVSPGEREQQAEECYGHGRNTEDEILITQHPHDYGPQALAPAKGTDIPDLLHGARQQHIAND